MLEHGRQYAYPIIDAAGVIEDLSPIGDNTLPANEAHVHPLPHLKDPVEQRPVWQEILAVPPEFPVTAARVREI